MSKAWHLLFLMVNIFNLLILCGIEERTPIVNVGITFTIGAAILFILELKNEIEKEGKDV